MSNENPSFTAPRSTSTSDRPKIPVGLQKGRCVSVIDYGTQSTSYNGQPKTQRQLYIGFEFPDLLHTFDETKGPQPLVEGRKLTWSFYKDSQMKRFINGWRGKALTSEEETTFEVSRMLNVLAWLTIEAKENAAKDKVYHNITNATLISKEQAGDVPDAINPLKLYHTSMGFECDAFKALHEWQQKIIQSSNEYKEYLAEVVKTNQAQVLAQSQAAQTKLGAFGGAPVPNAAVPAQTVPVALFNTSVPAYAPLPDDAEDDLPF
jgi:hypothetical protein